MNLFKALAISIGWLTSSLAGIGAILYACGYLITRAQFHLLGLDVLFEYGNEHYLQEGAKFFIVMGELLGEVSISLITVGGLIYLLFYLFNRTQRLGESLDKWKGRIVNLNQKAPHLWRGVAYFFLVILLFFHLIGNMGEFKAPLEISNLLYKSASDFGSSNTTEKITNSLLNGDEKSLNGYFEYFWVREMEAALLLLLAWSVASVWRMRILMALPFIIIFVICTIYLPMVYGVLVHPTKYPRIALSSENEMLANKSMNLFLLNKTDHEFILWDSEGKRVLWIPKEQVRAAEVKGIEFIFKRNQKGQ
jgi:hypothetical protein